jgi:predicted phage baseplate assembly protein
MSLPLPNLDDRRWADLVEQGRALIPLFAPEWTDHNASDPGVTLMELFAWIAEGDIYRLNRITDRQRRRLLQLLGVRPEPPRPASIVCQLRLVGPEPIRLPAGFECAGHAADDRPLLFRSRKALDVVPARLQAVQRRDATGFQDLTATWLRRDAIPAFGDDPRPGVALYLGFDAALPVHAWTTLFAVVAGVKGSLGERRGLLEAAHAATLPPHHDARVTWEYLAAGGGADRWLPLDADDDSRSLTLSGSIRVRPRGAMAARSIGRVPRALRYVRCRFADGAFDAAPWLDRLIENALELEQASPAWQTWSIAPGAVVSGTPVPGRTAALDLVFRNGAITELTVDDAAAPPAFLVLGYAAPTATAAGTLAVQAVLAGAGTGEPEQTVTISTRPIVEASFELYSLEDHTWRTWTRVDDFAASSRASAHYRLDPATGVVAFGDGERGRTPGQGDLLVAICDATAAEAGAGTVTAAADSLRNRVRLPDPGVLARLSIGEQAVLEPGAAAETLAHAMGRAIDEREASRRAVTADDVAALAQDTPGTRIARVAVRPNLHPALDCVRAPGVVTVVVLPGLPLGHPSPAPGLVAAVARRLERRRTIGTRILVIGPTYLEVTVRARVQAFDGVDRVRLRTAVAAALDRFLDPLRGGPEGGGWPLGRDVFRAEVMQAIDEIAGVDHVLTLALITRGGASCGNVCLRPTWLPVAGPHAIEVV